MGSDRGAGGGSTKYVYYYKNDGSSTYEQYSASDNGPMPKSISTFGWSRSGYEFVNWNTSADGTGTSYWETDPLPISSTIYLYAIWDSLVDISITYKGSTIATMSSSGTKTLNTAGTYCEDDITIDYTKTGMTVVETLDPNGGTIVSISGDPVTSLQAKTVIPTSQSQTISADSGYDAISEVLVQGDSNLISSNIASGVSIFGVVGTFAGGGGGVTMVSVYVDVNKMSLPSPWEYGCLVDGSSTVTRDEDYRVIVSCPENSMFVVGMEMMPPMGATGTVSYQEIYNRGGNYYYAVFAGTSGGSIY